MNSDRLLQTFLDLVTIDSPSKREAGVAAYCERTLRDLGCEVVIDDSTEKTGSDTGNLIATLDGTMPGTLMLSAHMDCVSPCEGVVPVVEDGVIRSQGATVLGGDDKVGIAATIETIHTLVESSEPHPTICVAFTVQEEVGLIGAKALAPKDIECDLCLVLDAGDPVGEIVVGAPFHYIFTATIGGRASHAGVEPEKGVSAIAVAANAISKMPLGRIDAETTSNVGTIHGGTADNVVSAQCILTGEARSLVKDKVEAVVDQMNTALRESAEEAGATIDVAWELEYPGFLYDENSPEVSLVAAAAQAVGLSGKTTTTGGGSDANILAGKDVPVLVLNTGMCSVHCVDETLKVADLEALTAWVIEVARTFDLGV